LLTQQIVGTVVVFVVDLVLVGHSLAELGVIEHSAPDPAQRDAREQFTDRQCQIPLEAYSRFSSKLLRQQRAVDPIELDTGS